MTADFDAYLVRKLSEQHARVEQAKQLALAAQRIREDRYPTLGAKCADAVLLALAWMEEHCLEDEE